MRIIFSLLLVLAFQFTASSVASQSFSLYEITEKTESDWVSKQVADMRRVEIKIDEQTLHKIGSGEIFEFDIVNFSGDTYQVTVRRIIEQPFGDWSLTGMINGEKGDSFTLSYSDGKIMALKRLVSEHYFSEIRFNDSLNNHMMVQIDPHQLENLSCGVDHEMFKEVDNNVDQNWQQQEFSEATGSAVIDVLIVYTAAAREWAENNGGINHVVNQSMALAQNSVDNSEIDLEFRLVHHAEVDYTEGDNLNVDLNNLTDGLVGNAHGLRDQFEADLVALFSDHPATGTVGLAWVPTISFHPSFGFSVSTIRLVSSTLVHTHEMGHNLGNGHQVGGGTNRYNDYASAYQWNGTDNITYRSVMWSNIDPNQREYFSNPDVSHMGAATGSYEGDLSPADNARNMRETMHYVANYRPLPSLSIEQIVLNNEFYNPLDWITLEVQLNETNANVSASYPGSNSYTLNHISDGLYRTTSISAPQTPGTYTLTVHATKTDFLPAEDQIEFVVVDPTSGNDVAVKSIQVDRNHIFSGGSFTLSGIIQNLGENTANNFPVFFRLINPDGVIVDEKSRNITLNPQDESSLLQETLRVPTNAPDGTYTAQIRTQMENDGNPSNDFKNISIIVGDIPIFSQYKINWGGWIKSGSSANFGGYTVFLEAVSNDLARVRVTKGSYNSGSTIINRNEMSLFDSNRFALIFLQRDLDEGGFDYGLPSSDISVEPNRLTLDAGSTGYYNVTSSSSRSRLNHGYGVDMGTVWPWLSRVNSSGGNFQIRVNVPLDASRRTYEFWPIINGDYVHILELRVNEPKNIRALSIVTEGGSEFFKGSEVLIQASFKNEGGYVLNEVPIKFEITGPDNFNLIHYEEGNFPRGETLNLSFSWNTTGVPLGQFNITAEAIVPDDPYDNNSVNTTVNIIAPPTPEPPILVQPNNGAIDIDVNPVFGWESVENAITYQLQLSNSEDFKDVLRNIQNISENEYQVQNLAYFTEYFWRVRSVNNIGTGEWSPSRSFTTIEETDMLTFSMKKGWNLFGLPMNYTTIHYETIFTQATQPPLSFENTYSSSPNLQKGYGYWVHLSNQETIEFEGNLIEQIELILNQGWSLVSGIGYSMSTLLVNDPQGVINSPWYGFDGAYYTADTIDPGYGYWVRASQPGTVTLEHQAGKVPA